MEAEPARDWTDQELQQLVTEVVRRASVDREFRSLVLKDPTAAISKVNSKPLPSDLELKFVDNSGSTKTIPLPDLVPGIAGEELSDAQLQQVAGGARRQVGAGIKIT